MLKNRTLPTRLVSCTALAIEPVLLEELTKKVLLHKVSYAHLHLARSESSMQDVHVPVERILQRSRVQGAAERLLQVKLVDFERWLLNVVELLALLNLLTYPVLGIATS